MSLAMLPPVLVAVLALAASAAAAAPLRVMGFGGSSNWPIFVAQANGLFARHGLEVELSTARDSTTQLAMLAEGRIDIAMTAFDNVVAWDERHDPASALVAFLGVNNGGRSSLIAAPRITGIPQLRGGRLGVDAVASGYALVLQEILHREGLEPGDYLFVGVGGSRQRWETLSAGRVDATLLNAPYDAVAEGAGYRKLASSSALGSYQGSVGAARRSWAEANANTIVAFVRAYASAVDWLHDAAHKDEAIAILTKRLGGMRRDEVERSYRELVAEAGGFSPHAAFDLEGARTVLELRRTYGGAARASHDVTYFYDARYYERALRVAQ
jgi:ABC-type nitrate/sulfonate/bicarbonate transport system substrate-binding protein